MASRSSAKCGGEQGLSLERAMIDPLVIMPENAFDRGGCYHCEKVTP